MNDFRSSIPNYSQKQMDISIHSNSEQQEKEVQELQEKKKKKTLLSLEYLMTTTILARIRSIESLKTPQKVIEKLKEFTQTLKMLEDVDLSHDWRYCEKLSTLWIDLKTALETGNFPKKGLEELFERFQKYPEESDHSLGYYLAHHTGEEWIPFPFMDILKKIHESKDEIHNLLELCSKAIRSLS